jgi:Xaa-Pro aminopeptidase
MDRSVFQERLGTLRKRLKRRAPDTLWISQPENRRYLSGFKAADVQLNESAGFLLITCDQALLLTDSRYTTEAREQAPDFQVVTLTADFVESLPGILSHLGTRKLGFEADYVLWGLQRRVSLALKKMDPPIRLLPVHALVERMREVKSEEELAAMARASDIMGEILDQVIPRMDQGRTESEIAWEIQGLAREAGAEGMAFPPIVASGPNGALPHAVPSQRRIQPGEPVVVDVGVRIDGYCCDLTRTVFPGGEPKGRFLDVYRTVRRAQRAALEAVRPGVETASLDGLARKIINDAGYGDYFGHALGHGVGLAAHESPRVGPFKPKKLRPGMVITVEPGIYIPGQGGVRLEEMVAVERKGPRILTRVGHFYDV